MRARSILLCLVLATAGLAGCLGTDDATSPQSATPDETPSTPNTTDYPLPDTITGMDSVSDIEAEGGSGLVVHDGYAHVAGQGAGFYSVDVSDPQNPERVSNVSALADVSPRDADVIEYDNRTVVALAAAGDGMFFVDVTDPELPKVVGEVDLDASAHNLATVPGEHLVYNSRSLGDPVEPGIDVVNVSDPENPTLEKVWTFPRAGGPHPVATTGCHDITVYPDADRAYCAGVTQTYVMDIQDPLDPSVLGAVSNPAINIHHWALPAQNHSLLIIGDEYGGTLAPACFGAQDAGPMTASTPTGAVWFYDISDPAAPVPLGYVSAPTETENPQPCTAHFGDLIGDRPLLATGWYNQGLLLVDFSDPTMPKIVDQAITDQNVWDARYTNGHLVTGNIGSGSSVLELVGE